MNDTSFKKILYIVLVGLPLMLLAWVFSLYAFTCADPAGCPGAAHGPERTSIPTLMPARMPVYEIGAQEEVQIKCPVAALTLMGAWVDAGVPETDPFTFTDANGTECEATFAADIQPLFQEANLWYSGALACVGCHNADIANASANMNLTTYEGIMAGSRRTSDTAAGNDILGGGVWKDSLLYTQLSTGKMPFGRPTDLPPVGDGPLVFAGTPKPAE